MADIDAALANVQLLQLELDFAFLARRWEPELRASKSTGRRPTGWVRFSLGYRDPRVELLCKRDEIFERCARSQKARNGKGSSSADLVRVLRAELLTVYGINVVVSGPTTAAGRVAMARLRCSPWPGASTERERELAFMWRLCRYI